jgi:O-antigen ligase
VFLVGILLGQAAALFISTKGTRDAALYWTTICFLISFLMIASLVESEIPYSYRYHADTRSTGPWVNPNIFGVLMGLGAVLAVGVAIHNSKLTIRKFDSDYWSWFKVVFFLVGVGLMARGLLHSLSRGAWVATACGLSYLAVRVFRTRNSVFSSLLYRNWLPLFVVTVSVTILLFWHVRHAEAVPVHRAMSVANANDFSWRNRIFAWEGALQIMAEHPWFGVGWNLPERLYQSYYLPPKPTEAMAIEMNDYLMLGATLGVPALFCFGVCFWLMLSGGSEISEVDSLQASCQAGVMVLLVGFWFDGGLFKLATASVFWTLLELGQTGTLPRPKTATFR